MKKSLCLTAMFLASCAAQPPGQPLQGQTEADMAKDVAACTPPSSVGDVMLTGGIYASMKRESEYKGCMKGKGYTAIPAMPKDPGPKSGG